MNRLWRKFILRSYKWYWTLPRRRRRVMGWTIVAFVLFMAFGGGYATYRGVKAVVQWTAGLMEETFEPDEAEPRLPQAVAHTSRRFTVDEKHPGRRMNLATDFNDINDTQLAAARRLGISPLATRDGIEAIAAQGRLVALHETQYYKVDRLTHSTPYLVPEASDFLIALGELLQEYDGTASRFIITSVLRTTADVKSLSRSNTNATQNSCHCYGTTFDITYNRWDRRGATYDGRLKENLARALYDLRQAGHCYVKFERKQACFHVTVRPR